MITYRFSFTMAAAAFMIAGVAACSDSRADSFSGASPPVAVRVAPVERLALEHPLRATGRFAQKRTLALAFKNGGTLRALLVQEADVVHRGQPLALVDHTEIDAEVAQAKASVEKADRDRGRIGKLFASASVAQSDDDNARTAADVAHAALATAVYNQRASTLVAPEDGRIDKRFVEVGEQVGPGTPIYAISGSAAGVVLRVGVIDRELPGLALLDHAVVTVDAFPGSTFAASVTEIAKVPSPTSGTYEVELRVESANVPLFAGMTAKVDIARHTTTPMPVVPLSSLVDADGSHAALYVLSSSSSGPTVARVPIEIGYFSGDRVAVLSGLDGSERIVTEGASFIEPGRSVRPIESIEAAHANR